MPEPPSRCGTKSGAQAHLHAGQPLCPDCRTVWREHMTRYRARRGLYPNTSIPKTLLAELLAAAPPGLRERAATVLGPTLLLDLQHRTPNPKGHL